MEPKKWIHGSYRRRTHVTESSTTPVMEDVVDVFTRRHLSCTDVCLLRRKGGVWCD